MSNIDPQLAKDARKLRRTTGKKYMACVRALQAVQGQSEDPKALVGLAYQRLLEGHQRQRDSFLDLLQSDPQQAFEPSADPAQLPRIDHASPRIWESPLYDPAVVGGKWNQDLEAFSAAQWWAGYRSLLVCSDSLADQVTFAAHLARSFMRRGHPTVVLTRDPGTLDRPILQLARQVEDLSLYPGGAAEVVEKLQLQDSEEHTLVLTDIRGSLTAEDYSALVPLAVGISRTRVVHAVHRLRRGISDFTDTMLDYAEIALIGLNEHVSLHEVGLGGKGMDEDALASLSNGTVLYLRGDQTMTPFAPTPARSVYQDGDDWNDLWRAQGWRPYSGNRRTVHKEAELEVGDYLMFADHGPFKEWEVRALTGGATIAACLDVSAEDREENRVLVVDLRRMVREVMETPWEITADDSACRSLAEMAQLNQSFFGDGAMRLDLFVMQRGLRDLWHDWSLS